MRIVHLFLALALTLTLTACSSERGPVSPWGIEANQTSSLKYALGLYDLLGVPVNAYLYKASVSTSLDDVYETCTVRDAWQDWSVVRRSSYGGALYVENIRATDVKHLRLRIVKKLRADGWKWVRGEREPDGKSSMMYRMQGTTRTNEPAAVMLYVTPSSQDPSRTFVYLAIGPEDQKERLKYDTLKVIQITSAF